MLTKFREEQKTFTYEEYIETLSNNRKFNTLEKKSNEIYKYKSGAIYEGEWLGGFRHGYGTMTWEDGIIYEGEWNYGYAEGKGQLTYPNGQYLKGNFMIEHEKFMNEALKEAKKAYNKEEVPVGAIIVKDGVIISRAHNLKETKKSSVCHAEILAIEKACKKLGMWRLLDCDMYVTLEPCVMCTGALINSRIRKLYIGTNDEKTGACGSRLNLLEDIYFYRVT